MNKSLTKTIIEAGAKLNPRILELATVENVSPLKIKVGGLPVSKENLLIAQHLIKYTRKINLNVNANGQIQVGGETGNIKSIQIDNKEMILESILENGDLLVVQEIENGQRYIVLDKVVEL